MKPFEIRLADHHARNARHLTNLRNFVADEVRSCRIDADELAAIREQIEIMECLDRVLTFRMKRRGIPV